MYSLDCPKLQLGLHIKLPSQLMHSSITARTLTYQRYVTGSRTIAPAPWSVAQIVTTTPTLAAITCTTKKRQITTQASNQPSPVCSRWVCNLAHITLCPYPLGVCTIWQRSNIFKKSAIEVHFSTHRLLSIQLSLKRHTQVSGQSTSTKHLHDVAGYNQINWCGHISMDPPSLHFLNQKYFVMRSDRIWNQTAGCMSLTRNTILNQGFEV